MVMRISFVLHEVMEKNNDYAKIISTFMLNIEGIFFFEKKIKKE